MKSIQLQTGSAIWPTLALIKSSAWMQQDFLLVTKSIYMREWNSANLIISTQDSTDFSMKVISSTNTLDSFIFSLIASWANFLLWPLYRFLNLTRHFKWYFASVAIKSPPLTWAKSWALSFRDYFSNIAVSIKRQNLMNISLFRPFSANIQFLMFTAWHLLDILSDSSRWSVALVSFEVLYFKWQDLCQDAWCLFKSLVVSYVICKIYILLGSNCLLIIINIALVWL